MVHTHNNHIVTCMSTDLLLLDIDCVSDRGASQIERKLHARRTRGKTHSCYMLTVCRSIGNWHVEIMWIYLGTYKDKDIHYPLERQCSRQVTVSPVQTEVPGIAQV